MTTVLALATETLASAGVDVAAGMNVDSCLAAGFVKADLLCSSCDILANFNLGLLSKDCSACCSGEGGMKDMAKYPSAVLEVCG